jgi:hypothetical protein
MIKMVSVPVSHLIPTYEEKYIPDVYRDLLETFQRVYRDLIEMLDHGYSWANLSLNRGCPTNHPGFNSLR